MTRYTQAYSSFVVRLAEVDILRKLASGKERQDAVANREEINALCRGAVVLLSSHLEAFIKGLGELTLDALYAKSVDRKKLSSQFYYHVSKDALDEVSTVSDPEKIAEKIFNFLQRDIEYWVKDGPLSQPVLAERFNKGFSNPAFDKTKKYFNRFGYADYSTDLARKLQEKFQPTINMVEHLVYTRNKIAHGDRDVLKTPFDIASMTSVVRLYGQTTDDVYAKWCGSHLCSIR